jgi:hypothetical protein
MSRINQSPRFGLADACAVAVALASAIAISRISPITLERSLGLPQTVAVVQQEWPWVWSWPNIEEGASWIEHANLLSKRSCQFVLSVGTPVLVLSAPGLALATIRGRPLRRRSIRGVGVLTTVISGLMVIGYLVNEYVLRMLSGYFNSYGNNRITGIWREIAHEVSVAVLAMWVVLALGRRWHAERHWRDRLGRALGGLWITYSFFDAVLSPLWLKF